MMRSSGTTFAKSIFRKTDLPVGDRWHRAKSRLAKMDNKGALSVGEFGDQFTNPNVYGNEGNIPTAVRYTRKMRKLYDSNVKNILASAVPDADGEGDVSRDRRLIELSRQGRRPENSAERRFSRAIDEEDLQLGSVASKRSLYKKGWHKGGILERLNREQRQHMEGQPGKGNTEEGGDEDEGNGGNLDFGAELSGATSGSTQDGQYTDRMHRSFNNSTPDELKQRYLADKEIAPTVRETRDLIRKLARLNEVVDEERVIDGSGQPQVTRFSAEKNPDNIAKGVQQRLVEEYAVYPSQRIDAFMLGDESVFPPWVHGLSSAIRDRVKYGGLGITEDEEALRVRLARMPLDARREEWARLKAAKAYEAGLGEQRINPRDIREARLVKRRNYILERKRQYRANILRRLAIGRPEEYAIHPSQRVDFSVRLAAIAQCVENGVDTKGKWPIDKEELHRAKIRNLQDHAERTFLKTNEERRMARSQRDNNMNAEIANSLQRLDQRVAPEFNGKRLSRKQYAVRVNNVKLGVMDHRGRKYRDLYAVAGRRSKAMTLEEARMNKEQYAAPTGINITNRQKSAEQHYMSGWRSSTSPAASNLEGMPVKP